MRRKLVFVLIGVVQFLLLGLAACTNQNLNIKKVSIIRGDLVENPISETLNGEIENILNKVDWSPGTKAEMNRKEDVQMNVTYEKYGKKSETNYLIWFSVKTAEFISSDDNESYGKLNEKETNLLKNIVGFHPSQALTEYTPTADDIVDTHSKVINMKRFTAFLIHVQKGEFDEVRVVTYTVEGDPILHDLTYNGKEIHSTIDTRRDKFGVGEIISTICRSIKTTKSEYELIGCKDPNHKFVLTK